MAVTAVLPSLQEDLAATKAKLSRAVASAEELTGTLTQIYRTIYESDLGRYAPGELAELAPQMVRELFDLRMSLRDQIPDWKKRRMMTRPAQKALRDVVRILRYAGDMFGEVATGHARLGENEDTRRAFTGGPLNTQIHRLLDTGKEVTFQSGDVLLVRGMRHNSAAIARIGDVDSQFSHISMLHVDPDGTISVVESLIEEGAIINTLDHAIGQGLGRAVLFRHRDAELAGKAADFIYDVVQRTRDGRAKHIYYDFSMRMRRYRTLFCSKLVRYAFDKASRGRVRLPTFPTRFDMKNRDFLDRIGVKATETFAPGDIELEPDFQLVAEWQDHRVTSRLRLQDLIMTKLFEWMDSYGYRFREDFVIWLISVFGRLSSRLSDRAKTAISQVVPKVPANMHRKTISAVAMLHKTAEPILEQLLWLDENRVKNAGRSLHPREVFEQLEQIREESGGRIGYLRGRKQPLEPVPRPIGAPRRSVEGQIA